MFASRWGDFDPAQHSGDLFDARMGVKFRNRGFGHAFTLLFADLEMVLAASGDLGQVCHAEHLVAQS